jgi:hypothetical protein
MTTTTTYTVYSPASGTVYGRGLDVTDAAEIILTHDGHEYEVRPADDGIGFDLFISRGSRNSTSGLGGFVQAWRHNRLIGTSTMDKDQAWREIAAQVVTAGWERVPDAMTDADYDAMLAEIARDAE